MQIVVAKPPNWDEVVEAFPHARDLPTIFAYGDVIYNPTGAEVPAPLFAHERVHCTRQREQGGPTVWWRLYITAPDFRYAEELAAHVAEYKHGAVGLDRNRRRLLLEVTAERLVAPLYGYDYKTVKQAEKDLKKEINR